MPRRKAKPPAFVLSLYDYRKARGPREETVEVSASAVVILNALAGAIEQMWGPNSAPRRRARAGRAS